MPEENDTPTTPQEPATPQQQGDATGTPAQQQEGENAQATATPTPTAKKEDTSSLSDNDSQRYINEEFAKVTFKNEALSFDNGQRIQISIFFAPKYIFSDGNDLMDESNYTFLEYGRTVKRIQIDDKLAKFGLSGSIDVVNTGEHLNFILDRLNCYNLVINFRLEESDDCGVRFEPYVLDVTSVSNLHDNSGENKQILRLNFVDNLSYIAMQHSMATVVKYAPDIAKRTSYREVFSVIMDYFKRFINVNYNGLYSFKKDLLYKKDYTKNSADTSALVTNSFRKLDPTCTIYEALEVLMRDAGVPIESTEGFKARYNDFDYMLVPVFFKEEYADCYGAYQKVYDPVETVDTGDYSSNSKGSMGTLAKIVRETGKVVRDMSYILGETKDKATKEKLKKLNKDNNASKYGYSATSQFGAEGMLYTSNFNGTNDVMIMRPMTLRDVHMPFMLCFTKDANIISESINPSKNADGTYTDSEKRYRCLNGRKQLGIAQYRYFPTNQNLVQKLWKNMVICNTGQQQGAGSVSLIEFNWVYQYYIFNFLGYGTGTDEGFTSNVTPAFFLAQKNDRISDSTIMSDFYELNANFQLCRSSSDLNEALLLIGKNLTSFVTQNDTYQFVIRGDLFRHPNEIIKISNSSTSPNNNPDVSIHTDMVNNDYILMYTTAVSHIWEGSSYRNEISANKIYEKLMNDSGGQL